MPKRVNHVVPSPKDDHRPARLLAPHAQPEKAMIEPAPSPGAHVRLASSRTGHGRANGALRAADILQLQRLHGNRVTQRLLRSSLTPVIGGVSPRHGRAPSRRAARDQAPIQRLTTGGDLLKGIRRRNARLNKIAKYLDQYNQIAAVKPQTAKQLNMRFRRLRWIDKRIYIWFDKVSTSHLRLAEHPDTDRMLALMRETEAEHIKLVQQTKNNPKVFPFDLQTVPKEQRDGVKQLWRSIVGGAGKIQLIGSPAHRRKTRSELAKLLSTEVGRELLSFLNTPTPSQPLGEPLSSVYIGDDVGQLGEDLRGQSPEVGDRDQSEAMPLGPSKDLHELGDPQELDGTEDLENDFTVIRSPADFRRAVLTGKQGVVLDDKKYLFSSGTGSFVKTTTKEPVSVGKDYHEIIKPNFITLGHELGHAAHQRAGGTTKDKPHMQSEFMPTLAHLSAEDAKLAWDNSEEFMNITNFENAIRTESGASSRTSHKSQGALLRTERLKEIDGILSKIRLLGPSVVDRMPTYENVAHAMFRHSIEGLPEDQQLHNDEIYQGLRDAALGLMDVITPDVVQREKKKAFDDARNALRPYRHRIRGVRAKAAYKPYKDKYAELMAKLDKRMFDEYAQPARDEDFAALKYNARSLARELAKL